MILHDIKRNLVDLKLSVSPNPSLSARPSRKVAHHNIDRDALAKRIQVAYRVSAQEAEAQIAAAEKRSALYTFKVSTAPTLKSGAKQSFNRPA
jgi:hypothetical protein